MLKKLTLSGLVAGLAMLLMQCSPDPSGPGPSPAPHELSAAERNMVVADNAFAFKIFKELTDSEGAKNVFISPLSISCALGMTYNGAAGTTREAMHATLEYGQLTDPEINGAYQSLFGWLTRLDPKVTFEIGNSIWYRQEFPVLDSFLDVNREYFEAEVTGMDFDRPDVLKTINDWCSRKTHGKIKNPLAFIDRQTVMFLINALYFKGAWTFEFDKSKTRDDSFHLPSGGLTACRMMVQQGEFVRLFNDDFQAVDLPYGNGSFVMTVFLPRPGRAVTDFMSQFNESNWQNWRGAFARDTVELHLPKFKVEYKRELNGILAALGMAIAFQPEAADFSRISQAAELFISLVLHKTFVQVDEEGTEAAAVTIVGIGATSFPSKETLMRVDRPFVFVIHEKESGAILFMGQVVNPEAN